MLPESGSFAGAAKDSLAEAGVDPKPCADGKGVEERTEGRQEPPPLSLDQDTEQPRDVEAEGKGGGASGFLINEHVGDSALQGECDGGDFTLIQIAVVRENCGNGGRLCERDERRKWQPGEARVGSGFALKFDA